MLLVDVGHRNRGFLALGLAGLCVFVELKIVLERLHVVGRLDHIPQTP